jgi:hypothetical protein
VDNSLGEFIFIYQRKKQLSSPQYRFLEAGIHGIILAKNKDILGVRHSLRPNMPTTGVFLRERS